MPASTVKVAGRDVLASWKVIVSLVLFPIMWIFYSACFATVFYMWPTLVEHVPFLVCR